MPKKKPAKTKATPVQEPDEKSLEKIFAEQMQNDERVISAASRWLEVECPYCGENFEVHVEASEEGQAMIQDCQVCCKPIQLAVEMEEGEILVTASRS